KLTTALPVKNDDRPEFALAVDPADNSSIFDLVQYKRADKIYVDAVINFDFSKGNTRTSREFEHTKENGEKLENDYKAATGKECSPIKRHYEDMKVVGIEVSGDKVVSIKEVDYDDQTPTAMYLNLGALVVTAYNKNLEDSYTLAIS